jgi:hypothetical protein
VLALELFDLVMKPERDARTQERLDGAAALVPFVTYRWSVGVVENSFGNIQILRSVTAQGDVLHQPTTPVVKDKTTQWPLRLSKKLDGLAPRPPELDEMLDSFNKTSPW